MDSKNPFGQAWLGRNNQFQAIYSYLASVLTDRFVSVLGVGTGGGGENVKIVEKCQNPDGTLRSGRVVPHPAPKNVEK